MSKLRPCRRRCPTIRQEDQAVHPYHAGSCRDKLQQAVAPRRQGPWVPSPWCNTHAGSRVPLGHEWQLGRSLFGMPARGPSRHLNRMVGSRFAAFLYGPPLPGGRRQLTHSPRREVVSGPAVTEGAHPTASGRLAVAVRPLSLWVASPGSESSPSSFGRFLGRRPSFLLR